MLPASCTSRLEARHRERGQKHARPAALGAFCRTPRARTVATTLCAGCLTVPTDRLVWLQSLTVVAWL
jgi:hypothetical protein